MTARTGEARPEDAVERAIRAYLDDFAAQDPEAWRERTVEWRSIDSTWGGTNREIECRGAWRVATPLEREWRLAQNHPENAR